MIRCKWVKIHKGTREKKIEFVHDCALGRKDDCYESLEKNGMHGPGGLFPVRRLCGGGGGAEHPF